MSGPVTKRERSLTPEIPCFMEDFVDYPDSASSSEDMKPPQAKPHPDMQNVKGSSDPVSGLFTVRPLNFAHSPSEQAHAMATGRVNKTANVSTITTPTTTTPGQHFGFEDTYLNEHNANMAHQGLDEDFELFPRTASNSPKNAGDSVVVPQGELQGFQSQVHQLLNAAAVTQHQIGQHNGVIGELVTFSRNTHTLVQQLNARITQLEAEAANHSSKVPQTSASTILQSFNSGDNEKQPSPIDGLMQDYDDDDDDNRSKSLSPFANRDRDRGEQSIVPALKNTVTGRVKKSKARKQLNITIPSNINASAVGLGLPTPMTKTATSIPSGTFESTSSPNTPITPGRIGPLNFNNRSKPRTMRISRGALNLDKIMAPIFAQIPLVPLTDTEVIVYFFQSVARPVVSLRLYARNWGPSSIVGVLNDHRKIEPEYLRNTCSVKCTTAIKKGKEMYGDEWEESYRVIFESADDLKATDLIRLTPDEIHNARNLDIRQLCVDLKKHPLEGVDGGIFTRCVKYVEENKDANYTLENVWKLASDLQAGRLPSQRVEEQVTIESETEELEKPRPSQVTKAPSRRSESPGSNASGLSTPLGSAIGDNSTHETDEST